MPSWYVRSGDLKAKVDAGTPEEAFKKAVERHKPKRLGLIVGFDQRGFDMGDDDSMYASTQRLLEDLGIWNDYSGDESGE